MTNNGMTKMQVLTALAEAFKGTSIDEGTEKCNSIILNDKIYEAVLAYLDNEIALLKSKAERAKSSLTKAQKINAALYETILNILRETDKALTINQITARSDELKGLSCQKISSLISPHVRNEKHPDGIIFRELHNKIAYYALEPNLDIEEDTTNAD